MAFLRDGIPPIQENSPVVCRFLRDNQFGQRVFVLREGEDKDRINNFCTSGKKLTKVSSK